MTTPVPRFVRGTSVLLLVVLLVGSTIPRVESFATSGPRSTARPATTLNEATTSFEDLKKAFPENPDIVGAGGWHNLERMALEVDPKKALVEFVVAGLRGAADAVQPKSANLANLKKINKSIEGLNFAEKIEALSLLLYGFGKLLVEFVVDFLRETASMVKKPAKATKSKSDKADTSTSEKLEALALLLYSKGKGFSADAIDGEWDLVFTKQGKKSPTFQKMVGSQETAGSSKNIFDVGKMVFHGGISFWKFGKVSTSVKYTPTSESFSRGTDGKIVVRRIVCRIVDAFFKWWKLPGIPFPLPKKTGYLDVVYLDEDIRVTKGNRGGFFVHFRPDFLKEQMAAA